MVVVMIRRRSPLLWNILAVVARIKNRFLQTHSFNELTSAITGTGPLAVGVRKQPECQRVGVRCIALFELFCI